MDEFLEDFRVKSIQFVWDYGRAWQWQMQLWTCSSGFIRCFTTIFLNHQSRHLATHPRPHLYTPKVLHSHWTRSMRIIDDDEVGLKEKPFDSEMRPTDWECGKTKTILFPIFMLGIILFILDHPPGNTCYDMQSKGCLLSTVSSTNDPFRCRSIIYTLPHSGKGCYDAESIIPLMIIN